MGWVNVQAVWAGIKGSGLWCYCASQPLKPYDDGDIRSFSFIACQALIHSTGVNAAAPQCNCPWHLSSLGILHAYIALCASIVEGFY